MNQTIVSTVSGIQTSQQTLGQALSIIESDVKDILAAISVPDGDGDGTAPPTDLTQLVALLTQITTALGTPASGTLATEIEANAAAIASLTQTVTALVAAVQGVGDNVNQINATVASNATAISNLDAHVGAVDSNVTSVGAQVTALAAQVAALQTSIASLANVIGDFGNVGVPTTTSQLVRQLIRQRRQ